MLLILFIYLFSILGAQEKLFPTINEVEVALAVGQLLRFHEVPFLGLALFAHVVVKKNKAAFADLRHLSS